MTLNLNIFHTNGVPADLDPGPNRGPIRNPSNKAFVKMLRQAARKGWKLDEAEATALVDEGVSLGHIDPDRAKKLIDKLKYGHVYLRTDGQWACTVCGGNCGQCGDTGFYGNIGMDMDVLGQTFSRLVPTGKPVSPNRPARTFKWITLLHAGLYAAAMWMVIAVLIFA